MKRFKEFGIKTDYQAFIGDKINIRKILNVEITVIDFRIKDSLYAKEKEDKCLIMQISIGDTKRVVFTGAKGLIEMIEKVPKPDFPFLTTIVSENDRYEFQ